VPATYEAPDLDWAPDGPPGSSLCAIRGRPQSFCGVSRESRFDADGATVASALLHCRDGADGASHTGDLTFWGMDEWDRGDLDVFPDARPPPLGAGARTAAPPSLAHLLLDCRGGRCAIATRASLS